LATFKGAAVGSVYTKKAARSTTSLVIIVSIQYLHDYLETAGIGDDVGGQESPECCRFCTDWFDRNCCT
jgi:hypothetical protein